jgi:hypothetical protein
MNRLLTTAILVAMLGIGAMSPPASAGGITVMLSPHGDSADIIQQGLQIYSMIKEEKDKKKRKNHAHVDQKGHDNAAALSQKGNDNYGVRKIRSPTDGSRLMAPAGGLSHLLSTVGMHCRT